MSSPSEDAACRKVLVIKPPYETIPVGFAYVLACLEDCKTPFDFIDTTFSGTDYESILKDNDYFAVATGGLVGQYRFFMDVVRQVRRSNPALPVIFGGNITKDMRPDFLFDKIGIDYGILGEAETALPPLLECL